MGSEVALDGKRLRTKVTFQKLVSMSIMKAEEREAEREVVLVASCYQWSSVTLNKVPPVDAKEPDIGHISHLWLTFSFSHDFS